MADRKKKKRALESAGLTHAAGWIRSEDEPKFKRLVTKAADEVKRVTND